VISVTGEVDVATSPELLAAIADVCEQGHAQLVIDLSGVTFVDSSGLGVMVQAMHEFEDVDRLHLVVSEPHVRKVFEITGLDGVLRIFTSLEAATETPRDV
jgi:anti-sigma B factor antagonist